MSFVTTLSDISKVFVDLQVEESKTRPLINLAHVNVPMKDASNATALDEFLFGNGLEETLKQKNCWCIRQRNENLQKKLLLPHQKNWGSRSRQIARGPKETVPRELLRTEMDKMQINLQIGICWKIEQFPVVRKYQDSLS